MRGTDPDPFIYVAHLGDSPRFLSSAWHVASEDDLKAAARVPGASPIENLDEPGGGRRVRLTDPIGYTVELVHGRQPVAAIPVEPVALNFGWDGLRRKTLQRFPTRPSNVKKIAHVVLTTPDVPPVVNGIAKRWDWCNRKTSTPAMNRTSLAHSIAAIAAMPTSITTCSSAVTEPKMVSIMYRSRCRTSMT